MSFCPTIEFRWCAILPTKMDMSLMCNILMDQLVQPTANLVDIQAMVTIRMMSIQEDIQMEAGL